VAERGRLEGARVGMRGTEDVWKPLGLRCGDVAGVDGVWALRVGRLSHRLSGARSTKYYSKFAIPIRDCQIGLKSDGRRCM
jgi:hypothetical protein